MAAALHTICSSPVRCPDKAEARNKAETSHDALDWRTTGRPSRQHTWQEEDVRMAVTLSPSHVPIAGRVRVDRTCFFIRGNLLSDVEICRWAIWDLSLSHTQSLQV